MDVQVFFIVSATMSVFFLVVDMAQLLAQKAVEQSHVLVFASGFSTTWGEGKGDSWLPPGETIRPFLSPYAFCWMSHKLLA